MEGLICALKRTAVHDGDGLRTTVFFKGCPLKCIWCHNPEGIGFQPEIGFFPDTCIGCGECVRSCPKGAVTLADDRPVTDRSLCDGCGQCAEYCPGAARVSYGQKWSVDQLVSKLLQDRRFYELSGGGVTLSGGECLAQGDFAIAVAQALHAEGISVDIDTCGFVRWEILERIAPYTDTFLYDLKAIDPAVHKKCTGQDNRLILDNLRRLCHSGCKVEIRYPYVPGWNDDQCDAIGAFLAPLKGICKVKVLGYHGYAGGKYAALNMPNTLPNVTVLAQDLDKPVAILRTYGLNAINAMVQD